jgi:hypothetical protein
MRLNGLISYFFMLGRNIIFQGILYMSLGEKLYKVLITLLLALLFNAVCDNFLTSIIFGHLLNYILNGQFYVVHRFVDSSASMKKDDLVNYFLFVDKAINMFRPLDVLIIGGYSRGIIKRTSDLDMRIYHSNTVLGSTKAYLMATVLRFHGLITRFPIDVFCFSKLDFLDKIRDDEIPINFRKNHKILQKYPLSKNYRLQMDKIIYSS